MIKTPRRQRTNPKEEQPTISAEPQYLHEQHELQHHDHPHPHPQQQQKQQQQQGHLPERGRLLSKGKRKEAETPQKDEEAVTGGQDEYKKFY